jgi:pyroglutamyl-peptidase
MSNKVLVSGFERFGFKAAPNPSSEIALPAIEEQFGDTVETIILPVAYDQAAAMMRERLLAERPRAVIMFGSAGLLSRHVSLEAQGTNFRSNVTSLIPDNNFHFRHGSIVRGGPQVIPTTLPNKHIHERLTAENIPTKISQSAGRFVCNDLLYQTLHAMSEEQMDVPTGFVHLGVSLPEDQTVRTAVATVDEVLAHIATNA